MSSTPEAPACEHDWKKYQSICTYSNGDVQHAYTCQCCGENKITINGVQITETEAQKICDDIDAGRLTELWTLEGQP